MIDDVITLAETLATNQTIGTPPNVKNLTYKQKRDAAGKFIFDDEFMDCSEFIYYLLHEKYNSMYGLLSVGDTGNTTTLKTKIEQIGGAFSSTPKAKSLALWWDDSVSPARGSHVELVIKVVPKPIVVPQPQDYQITSIGARGSVGTPVPKKTTFQSYNSFDNINPNTLLGFWDFSHSMVSEKIMNHVINETSLDSYISDEIRIECFNIIPDKNFVNRKILILSSLSSINKSAFNAISILDKDIIDYEYLSPNHCVVTLQANSKVIRMFQEIL